MGNLKGWTADKVEALAREMSARSIDRKEAAINAKPKESANQITNNLIRAINMQPRCVAYRINNVGVWDAAKEVYRKGNTQKGIFDISAIIRGRAVWIEIKAGRDKPSPDQLIFQQEVRLSGGVAEFVYSTDEGLKLLTKLISE